jgi:hypothetical protein
MPSEKNSFNQMVSHIYPSSFSSWFLAKPPPRKAFLRVPNNDLVGQGQYCMVDVVGL